MAKAPQRPILRLKEDGPKKAVATKKKVVSNVGEETNLSSAAVDAILPQADLSIREIRAKVEDVFNALGTDQFPGTVIPAGKSNNAREAADFVLADTLAKLAATRLKAAHEAAEKAGVFGNPDEYVAGDTVMVFSDPNFSINVKMGKPSKMIGREEVEAAAEKYLGKKAQEFLDECMKERKATKQIIVSMK